jgi:hypothetical protein
MAWCAQPLSDSPRGCPLGTPRLAGIDRQPGSLGRSQGYTVHSLSNKQKCIARCVLLSVCWQLALASAAQESLAETGLTQGHVRSTLAVGDHNVLFAQEVSWKEAYEYCQEHVDDLQRLYPRARASVQLLSALCAGLTRDTRAVPRVEHH